MLIIFTKHHRSDLHRANAAFLVKLANKSLSGIFIDRNLRIKTLRIYIYCMPADRINDRNSFAANMLSKICCTADAVMEVIRIKHFAKADCNGIHIAPGKSAVCCKPFCYDKQIGASIGKSFIFESKKSANVNKPIFLSAHDASICQSKHLLSNLAIRTFLIAFLSGTDKIGILRDTACIEKKKYMMCFANFCNIFCILH